MKLETTVRARPNHYETLGITPTAASDEIARAFARETSVFRPHSFGGVAEVCMAYETLRDPIKRRAYDASLGILAEPSAAAPGANPKLRPDKFVHPALGSLKKAAAPRKPVKPTVVDRSPAPAPHRELRHRPAIDQIAGDRTRNLILEEQLVVGISPIDWKRGGMMAGGIALAACLIGGLAGWWSAPDAAEAQPPGNSASFSLPPAEPLAIDATPPAPTSRVMEVRNNHSGRPAELTPAPERGTAAAEQARAIQPQDSVAEQSEPGSVASEQAVASAPIASTTAAAMPLPNKVVARTIDRIGYACGAVASTNAVEGEAPGVYKVTCTSGQSFQARPVNGRYRFRRLGSR